MKRRSLLAAAGLSPLVLSSAQGAAGAAPAEPGCGEFSLCGPWQFRPETQAEWEAVNVPHTWQTTNPSYLGKALYRREVFAPAVWKGQTVRLEFEAVFHSAEVSVNGVKAGEHQGKGYTAFVLDLTRHLKYGASNVIEVAVHNEFRDDMLPRNGSYDWTPDGGIYRPVTLHVTPAVFIDNVWIDAVPSTDFRSAAVDVRVELGGTSKPVEVECEIVEEPTGRRWGAVRSVRPKFTIEAPKLWHFDHPNLYTAHLRLGAQTKTVTFGVRRFEVRGTSFFLNGEKMRPIGVERMAGSHPEYGMAEPLEWIEHDHRDMKELNCVFTRVHWMQDRRLLDWCDQHGMMMQLEVPSWGPNTFQGMPTEPGAALMQNALEQLREMIRRDYNHPSVVVWGLCNEINGQGEAQKVFVRRLKEEARKLDAHRPLTYASHSLFKSPGNDISGEMDFVSWNQYFGSWQKGGVPELKATLQDVVKAFPGKPIVISEYGYCACTADRPEGDAERIAVLEQQNALLRTFPEIAGLIFFCYNDYRTHMGDKGEGVLRQRVHGVVDVYGQRKPSFSVLQNEASPVESLEVRDGKARIRNRGDVPSYPLRGYSLRWTAYGRGDIPLRTGRVAMEDIAPGGTAEVALPAKQEGERRIRLDIMRPTGFPAYSRWI